MGMVLGGSGIHWALAQLIPWSWGVPDATLIGLLLGVTRSRHPWPALAATAGVSVALWAGRSAPVVAASYLVCGWLAQAVAHRWDLADPRVHGLFTAAARLALTLSVLWVGGVWAISLVVPALLHAVITGLVAMAVCHRMVVQDGLA